MARRRARGPGLFDRPEERVEEPRPAPVVDPLAEQRAASKAWLAESSKHVPRRRGEDEPSYLTRVGSEWARRFPELAEEGHRAARLMKAPTLREMRGGRR